MIGLIFNLTQLRKYKDKVKNFFDFINESKHTENLLFIVMHTSVFENLEEKTVGDEKLEFIDSTYFLKKIIYYNFIHYKDNQLFLKTYDKKYLKLFLEAVHLFFEEQLTIVAEYDKDLIKYGFKNPELCGVNDICILKTNVFEIPNPDTVETQALYISQQKDNDYCEIVLKLTGETIDFLKHICRAGVTKRGGKRSQKEFFGKLHITESKTKAGDIIHLLEIDKNTLQSGGDDEIDGSGSLYNFHSHPFQAYLKYKVKYGVPSITDYISMHKLVKYYNCVVHFVSSLEGLYAISINPDNNMIRVKEDKDIIKFIQEKMSYPNAAYELEDYIDFINKKGLFNLQLIKWDDFGKTQLKIKFLKSGRYKQCKIH